MSSIFGGSHGQSQSGNLAYPQLSGAFSGNLSNGTGANNQMANLLGLNGGPAQTQGFNNWKNSTGYQFGLHQGMDSITGNAATQGLLNSGSTLKALDTYGQNYADTQYGNYFNQLNQLNDSGIRSGGVLAQAGQFSNGNTNSNNGGLGGFIGSLLSKG